MNLEDDKVDVQVLLLNDKIAEELEAELVIGISDDEVEIGMLMLVDMTIEETTTDVKPVTEDTVEERWTVVVL